MPNIDESKVGEGGTCSFEQNVMHFWFSINPHLSWFNIKFLFNKLFVFCHALKSDKGFSIQNSLLVKFEILESHLYISEQTS